jgi:hypothetical protein
MRIAALYAVLDCSSVIRPEHLAAALAVWEYCEASAVATFGDAIGDQVADEILLSLRSRGSMTRTEISTLFARHKNKEHIERALELLSGINLIIREYTETGGRRAEVWRAVTAKEANYAK